MVDATSDARTSRPLRLGMVGGGRGAFIGAVHRLCARLDGQFELVAGALSSDAQRARDSGADLALAPDRVYTSFAQMAAAEAKRSDGVEVVRSEEHTSELQSLAYLVCRLLLEKKKKHHYTEHKSYACGRECVPLSAPGASR